MPWSEWIQNIHWFAENFIVVLHKYQKNYVYCFSWIEHLQNINQFKKKALRIRVDFACKTRNSRQRERERETNNEKALMLIYTWEASEYQNRFKVIWKYSYKRKLYNIHINLLSIARSVVECFFSVACWSCVCCGCCWFVDDVVVVPVVLVADALVLECCWFEDIFQSLTVSVSLSLALALAFSHTHTRFFTYFVFAFLQTLFVCWFYKCSVYCNLFRFWF